MAHVYGSQVQATTLQDAYTTLTTPYAPTPLGSYKAQRPKLWNYQPHFVDSSSIPQGYLIQTSSEKMFVCSFGTELYSPEKQAQPLETMCARAPSGPSFGFEVAAGWQVGNNDRNSWIYYFLCREVDELDEPWQWRIFINNIDFLKFGYYDSLDESLGWYSSVYDWVDWDAVQSGVNDLLVKCMDALEVNQG